MSTVTVEAEAKALLEFQQFLNLESRLTDEHRYIEWLRLWSPDALYWVPSSNDNTDPDDQVSIIYENHDALEDRVLRLDSKFAHSQTPQSRLLRVISHVELSEITASSLSGSSHFVLGEVRNDRQHVWFGRTEHELVRTPDGFRMKQKKVVLLNNGSPMKNLTFLI